MGIWIVYMHGEMCILIYVNYTITEKLWSWTSHNPTKNHFSVSSGAKRGNFADISECFKSWVKLLLPLQVIFVLQELQSSHISLQHLEILDFLLKLFEEVPLKGCSLRGMEAWWWKAAKSLSICMLAADR